MSWDINILFFLNDLAGKLAVFDAFIIFLASYSQYILGGLFLIFVLRSKLAVSKARVFWVGATAVIVSRGIITALIRYFYHRPRPFAVYDVTQLVAENDFSFPSGHAMFFFALSAVVFYFNKRWGTAFFIGSILMGIARVVSGVHYPTDIIGGALLGIAIGYIVSRLTTKKNKQSLILKNGI